MTEPSTPRRWGAPPPLDRLPDPRTKREWASMYVASLLTARKNPDLRGLGRFCFFIGYARSGHTLVATLLNAHRQVVIAHELDAVRFVRRGFRRSQLFSLLLQRDQQFGEIGRTWSGYRYEVPGQFQGRFEQLEVIGDKRARAAALQLADQPMLLDRIRRVVKVPIMVLHVTRNPYDNIATEARRHNMSLSEATDWYEKICRSVAMVRPMLDPSELIDLRYEDFAADTQHVLAGLCSSMGVEADVSYLEASAGIVWPSTNRSRDAVEWSEEERRGVERLIETYDVLGSYTFDS